MVNSRQVLMLLKGIMDKVRPISLKPFTGLVISDPYEQQELERKRQMEKKKDLDEKRRKNQMEIYEKVNKLQDLKYDI